MDPSDYEQILRKNLADYDLDHKVDLQVGGKDLPQNLQFLNRAVNRSVGAQLRNQKAKGQFVVGDPESSKTTKISEFIIGEPR